MVCSGTLGRSDWFQQCPQCCYLALLSWAIVSFAGCSLAEEKMCKINMAGELPREAGWQLTLLGSPAPKNLLLEFGGSCCVFISLGGGFVLADTYQKRSGTWMCVKESAGEVSCHFVTSRTIAQGKRLFSMLAVDWELLNCGKSLLEVFGFSAELTKPWLIIQLCSQCSASVLEVLNVSSPDLPEVARRPDSVVKTAL